ncbi:MAG: hypothetical protein EAX89_15430 [Candidatus Lokiarchaeota archaeon]|nr:hypothetical protein [Candidatus Lokiarchaeota archaeon]
MSNAKGTAALSLMGIFLYLGILFSQPIYERLWLQFITSYFPQITTQYLGFILLVVAIAFLGGSIAAKPKKHPLLRNGLFIMFVFLTIMAIYLIFPVWFYSYWRF